MTTLSLVSLCFCSKYFSGETAFLDYFLACLYASVWESFLTTLQDYNLSLCGWVLIPFAIFFLL